MAEHQAPDRFDSYLSAWPIQAASLDPLRAESASWKGGLLSLETRGTLDWKPLSRTLPQPADVESA